MQIQLGDVDALVAGEGGVSRPGLEAQPALVFELLLLHVLAEVNGTLCKQWEMFIFYYHLNSGKW